MVQTQDAIGALDFDDSVEGAAGLLWDDHNDASLARHDVTRAEVTALLFGSSSLAMVRDQERPGRREFYGRTEAGRYLLVVTESPAVLGFAYVVTARPMNSLERQAFEEWRGPDA